MKQYLKVLIFCVWLIMSWSCEVKEELHQSEYLDLQKYRWKNRICLVFSPSQSDPSYLAFRQQWSDQISEIKDRDLVLIEIVADSENRVNGNAISESSKSQLYTRFRIDPQCFEVILIGKDGSEKLRGDRISVGQLFQRIDSMPMRQEEMKRKNDLR